MTSTIWKRISWFVLQICLVSSTQSVPWFLLPCYWKPKYDSIHTSHQEIYILWGSHTKGFWLVYILWSKGTGQRQKINKCYNNLNEWRWLDISENLGELFIWIKPVWENNTSFIHWMQFHFVQLRSYSTHLLAVHILYFANPLTYV